MLLQIKNAPVAIEPGVAAIEVEMCMTLHGVRRDFPAQLGRVEIDKKSARALPFLADTKHCHVFSVTQNVAEATLLLQYESSGRIYAIYTKDESGKSWERREIPDEYAGKTIKQFSVRYFFATEGARNDFMSHVDVILRATREQQKVPLSRFEEAFKLLAKSRTGPVALPVHTQPELEKQKA